MPLNINIPAHYDGRFPNFRKPSEIGSFSLDGKREFHNDNRQLKYIKVPRQLTDLNMDLNIGYKDAIRKDFGANEKISIMLEWILHNQDKVKNAFHAANLQGLDIDFVCFRGLLTVICATIYENKDDWMICASKYKSIIYLCAFETDESIYRKESATERDKVMTAWGYKFEQYMVSATPDSKPDLSVPVNEKEEYCIVTKGRLNNHTLLYSAEVDGKDPSLLDNPDIDPQSTKSYIELKTSRIITTNRQNRNFCRFKLLKWWLQSFLVGIPKIVCGFRDDHGIVQSLKVFPTAELPKMAQDMWSPAACLNFCSHFFDFVKKSVKKDDPSVVYRFYCKPGSHVTCEEMTSPSEYQVLPEWYTSNLKI